MSDRPLLLLISSLSRTSREPFLQSVARHYRVWAFVGGEGRPAEVTWEEPYLAGHTTVDTLDAAACEAAARELILAGETVAGVLSYDETRVETTAELATALGLPTSPPEAVARCRDKAATRAALAAAAVPQPRSLETGSLAEAARVAARWGYPVVVKPRNQACGFAVTLVSDAAGLPDAYAAASAMGWPETPAHPERPVLVEEFVAGPEISVDSAVFDDRVEPMVVARKRTGFPPSFEETGHLVSADDPLRTDPQLRELLERTHAALGFTTGVTHTEIKLSDTGFQVIEVNARLGGGLIPYLGQLATGADVGLAAAAIACGATPELTGTAADGVAEIRFFYPERDMTVRTVRVDADLLPPGTVRADVLADDGQRMLLPPAGAAWQSRLAQIVVAAHTAEECAAALAVGQKAITIEEEA
ncbi:ATP-grasp domain-containing protein [Micromonospora chokoriensis]